MLANAQRHGRPAEHRWRPLFNTAKFGWRPLLECRAVTLPTCQEAKLFEISGPKLTILWDIMRTYCCMPNKFFADCRYVPWLRRYIPTKSCHGAQMAIFPARRGCASAVLGVVILSVRVSVCQKRALWLIQRSYRRYFYTTWKDNLSSFLPPNSGWWATSLFTFNGRSKWPTPSKIAHVDRFPPVTSQLRSSEKSSIMTNRKSYTGFPTSYEVRTLTKSPKGGSKSELFLFWNTSHLHLNEVCYKVSLRENFQRQSCSTLIPLSNGRCWGKQ